MDVDNLKKTNERLKQKLAKHQKLDADFKSNTHKLQAEDHALQYKIAKLQYEDTKNRAETQKLTRELITTEREIFKLKDIAFSSHDLDSGFAFVESAQKELNNILFQKREISERFIAVQERITEIEKKRRIDQEHDQLRDINRKEQEVAENYFTRVREYLGNKRTYARK